MEKPSCHQAIINNDFYETLHEKWYTAQDHPVALLRAENSVRTPWVIQEIEKRKGAAVRVLDIGCGAGLLTNPLALSGHDVDGIDLSENSLKIAKQKDATGRVRYRKANAYALPFEDGQFDVVCAMDILEHVEKPQQLIAEASRVLRHGGLFFFHTFNRNLLSYIVIIKGVEWFVKNTPPRMHVYDLFLKPVELKEMCRQENLVTDTFVGLVPDVFHYSFWKMLVTREVPQDFQFTFIRNLLTGYCGIASKGAP